MTSDPFPDIDPSAPVLVGVSVVAVAESNNPSILNPDFLREVVLPEQSWEVQDSPICTPVYARVSYSNGISVQSDANRVVFDRRGDSLDAARVLVADMARRYVLAVPYVKYTAIGVNPSLLLAVPEYASAVQERLRDVFFPSHHGILPTILPKAVYAYPDRSTTIETQEARRTDTGDTAILFRGNIHRDVQGDDQRARSEHITEIINAFQTDLEDFRILVGSLDPFARSS